MLCTPPLQIANYFQWCSFTLKRCFSSSKHRSTYKNYSQLCWLLVSLLLLTGVSLIAISNIAKLICRLKKRWRLEALLGGLNANVRKYAKTLHVGQVRRKAQWKSYLREQCSCSNPEICGPLTLQGTRLFNDSSLLLSKVKIIWCWWQQKFNVCVYKAAKYHGSQRVRNS